MKMKHIKTFSSFINEAQRNLSMEAAEIHQLTDCGQDAAQDFIDDNNLDGKKIVEYLRKNNKMTAYDVRDFIAGSGSLGANKAFRAKFIKQFLKESLNEDISLALTLLLSAAAANGLLFGSMALNRAAGGDMGDPLHPIDDLKAWWAKRKKDKAVQSIVDKLKDDPDVSAFMNLSNSAQRGKWYKLIEPKLNDEEKKYLKSITRTPFMNNESVNEAKDKADAEINKLEKALNLSAGSGVFKDVVYNKNSKTLMLVQPTDISPLDAGAVLSAINREKKKLTSLYPGIAQVVLDKLKITI